MSNTSDFIKNQENDMNAFIKSVHNGDIANLAIIEIDNFQGIGIVYGIKAIIQIVENFSSDVLSFFPKDYTLFTLGFGVFALSSKENIKLDDFVERLNTFNDFFIKREFHIHQNARISLALYIGISSKFNSNGPSRYRFNVLKESFCALLNTRNTYKHLMVFDKEQNNVKNIQNKIRITKMVYYAFMNNGLIPYFQPIVDVKNNEIFKYEALARIHTSTKQVLHPKDFFQVLKKTVVYTRAIKQLIQKTLEITMEKNINVSINLTITDIEYADVGEWLLEKIIEYDIGKQITIEITEQEHIRNFELLADFFFRVKQTGAKVAVDDFGCGYSNLEILMYVPVDYIKIDGSFIIGIDKDPYKTKIVGGIVEFAKTLGIKTVAEFVSTEEIYKCVEKLGVDLVQGYFTGKPTYFG